MHIISERMEKMALWHGGVTELREGEEQRFHGHS
jgi:hypothetical protein